MHLPNETAGFCLLGGIVLTVHGTPDLRGTESIPRHACTCVRTDQTFCTNTYTCTCYFKTKEQRKMLQLGRRCLRVMRSNPSPDHLRSTSSWGPREQQRPRIRPFRCRRSRFCAAGPGHVLGFSISGMDSDKHGDGGHRENRCTLLSHEQASPAPGAMGRKPESQPVRCPHPAGSCGCLPLVRPHPHSETTERGTDGNTDHLDGSEPCEESQNPAQDLKTQPDFQG